MPGGYVTKLCSKKLKQSLPPKQEPLQKMESFFADRAVTWIFLFEKNTKQWYRIYVFISVYYWYDYGLIFWIDELTLWVLLFFGCSAADVSCWLFLDNGWQWLFPTCIMSEERPSTLHCACLMVPRSKAMEVFQTSSKPAVARRCCCFHSDSMYQICI